MKKYWTLREERALSLLKANGILSPTIGDLTEALQVVDNCSRLNTRIRAKEHLGAYDNAKQDLTKYTPVLQTGPAPAEQPDVLTQWLIQRRKGER